MRGRKEATLQVETILLGELETNCYVVTADGVTAVIDPAEASDALFALIKNRRIDLVLNTHGPFDHVGGDWVLQENGASVRIHRADLPFLDHAFPQHPAVDGYLEEGDEILPGLRVLHVPGHSPGSVAFLGKGVLFTGDLLFAESIGRTDLRGGSPEAIQASLRRIVALPGDYRVYPGHGPRTTLERERTTNGYLLELRDE